MYASSSCAFDSDVTLPFCFQKDRLFRDAARWASKAAEPIKSNKMVDAESVRLRKSGAHAADGTSATRLLSITDLQRLANPL